MIKDKQAHSALLAVFPNLETLHNFIKKSDNQKVFHSFVEFAFQENLIPACDENALTRFIQNHARDNSVIALPKDLTFEELFKKKNALLNIGISERAMTDRINALIQKKKIDLPKLTNTMLTRLKKEPADTPHKRNALRCLSFWLGYERPDIDPSWNYETLFRLCQETNQPRSFNEGVRIGLTLSSRGDVIGHDAVVWLKNNVKNYIQNSINLLPYGSWGKVKSYDITTIFIDFPKEGRANYPTSYQRSIRNAISVAHQMAIRWALSDYCTKNRFLSIGIATGDFANLDNYLLPILNAKLPGDPVIRMTDYTHQCILISDIRTVFCPHPKEATLFNGETLNIWWVSGLWSSIYWDFIPHLLEDEIMQNKPSSVELLSQFFMFPEQLEEKIEPNAITRFFSFPHNSLLGIEIAKTLYYRRSFWEANEILRIVLSIDPTNLNARALRMALFRNLAIEAPSHAIAGIQFKRAEEEAQFILENCNTLDEDFFCEYAVINLSRAVNTLRRMRESADSGDRFPDFRQMKSEVIDLFARAEKLFERGIMVSPTGYRSIYLLVCTQIIKDILLTHEEFFTDARKPISVPKSEYRQKALDIFLALNWVRKKTPDQVPYDYLEKILIQSFSRHDESVTLKAYRPTLYFCFAVVLWDFFPTRTVSIVKHVLQLLKATIPMARELEKQNLCIYSYTRCYGEMLRPGTFIQHIEKSIQLIEAGIGTMEELEKQDPAAPIDEDNGNFTLLTIHI
ncbi:MAG: hypothetical protein ABIK15_20825 [Pseudomonadota bacterium]